MRKWAATFGILGALWMLVLLWVRSPRLVFITDYPALVLTASLVPLPLHGSAFIFYASLVLCSAIQWAVIGLLFAHFRRIQNEPQTKLRTTDRALFRKDRKASVRAA
jgi:hypothetical protein